MCNGENGHASTEELSEDPIATSASEQNTKKKRKSSAEKFLEDNSEYYGFQVLPSKLRSSSVESSTSFPNPFLDYLHRSNATQIEVQQVREKHKICFSQIVLVETNNTFLSVPRFYYLSLLTASKGCQSFYLGHFIPDI